MTKKNKLAPCPFCDSPENLVVEKIVFDATIKDLEQENEWLEKELERKSYMAERFANELEKDEEECESLYNEIEQLQAELDEHKWISVDDRLPEDEDLWVLVYYSSSNYCAISCQPFSHNITHWQFLPEPPEKE
ncbi:MAG TPA: DUF551 domain-containing protein [Thermodesulfobacteriota bacterium]|nr:DUF551 domain-containing protein [Thermodesulfobacteriota bacterium]